MYLSFIIAIFRDIKICQILYLKISMFLSIFPWFPTPLLRTANILEEPIESNTMLKSG